METSSLLAMTALVIAISYFLGRGRSLVQAANLGGIRNLNSLPFYYGASAALWCGVPTVLVLLLWLGFDDAIIHAVLVQHLPLDQRDLSGPELGLLINSIENLALGNTYDIDPSLIAASDRLKALRAISQQALTVVVLLSASAFTLLGWFRVRPEVRARVHVENAFKLVLLLCSSIAILTTVGIVFSVLFESLRFFQSVPLTDFLFGVEWSPQTAIRVDQVGGSGSFGAVPLFVGTLLISAIAMLVAVPTGLMAAIYLSEYASRNVRAVAKPMLELLAGIPTVVYGFFAAITVAPFIRQNGELLGLSVSSESALSAGLVMGVMIIPFVSSLSEDVINAVPQSLRDGSYGLGATQSETIKQVVIPAALPGIVGGVLLAVSRAIGETMIVVMAAGLSAHLTANPLESVTTITVQIVTLLVGDQEFDSPKTLSAFALGLMLFLVTLVLNYIALYVVRKYREQYE